MQIEVFDYSPSHGWGIEPFPPMDSERTLVLVFGDSAFQDDPAPSADRRGLARGRRGRLLPMASSWGCCRSWPA
jgi:hypothetical protein